MRPEDFANRHLQFLSKHKGIPDWAWFHSRILGRHKLTQFEWFLETMSNIPHPKKVLDLAGGLGMYGVYMQKVERYKFQYVIYDLSDMLKYSKKYVDLFGVDAELICGDVKKPLKFESNKFDMIWFFGWSQFENVNHKEVFTEIYRVLKPNGVLLFDIINVAAPVSIRRDKLRKILEEIGFKVKVFRKDTDYGLKTFSVIVKNTQK